MNYYNPYENKQYEDWESITKNLISNHPLSTENIQKEVLNSWEDIFNSSIGVYKIGVDIFPQPQIMGFFLHELIALHLHRQSPREWSRNNTINDKDLVYLSDTKYSIKIKTSSHPNKIFGNRSYAQKTESTKGTKSGYYLAVNFEKFDKSNPKPKILIIRFGWLDHTDWVGQKSASGQQAHIPSRIESKKLLKIYELKKG